MRINMNPEALVFGSFQEAVDWLRSQFSIIEVFGAPNSRAWYHRVLQGEEEAVAAVQSEDGKWRIHLI